MNKEKWVGTGGMAAAFAGSLCCVGPVVLAGLGVGAISAVRELGVLHLPMMILALALLGWVFFLHYGKRSVDGAVGACCSTDRSPPARRGTFLWISSGVVGALFLFPYFL